MTLGERLLELRKSKHLSQEDIAEKLNVTRQTISKWETDQSTPDFDKIIPICELFDITSDELLTGIKKEEQVISVSSNNHLKEKAKGIGFAIVLFFVGIAWIMISIPVLMINPVISTAIFMLIIGSAVYMLVFTSIAYKTENKKEDTVFKSIDRVVSSIFLIIYLLLSFITMAWHLTWIVWIIYVLVLNIIKLIINLKGDKNEK